MLRQIIEWAVTQSELLQERLTTFKNMHQP